MAELFPDRLSLPVIAAPMFLISGVDLVTSCCKAGIIGSFPALNQRTTEGYDAWLSAIKEGLDAESAANGSAPAPFGVNLIVHRTNARLEADLKVTVKHQVPLVITSLGAVSDIVDAVHSYGGKVLHDVTTRRHAEKAIEAGVDGLICVSAGAGGHAGTKNPMAFISEVRSIFDGVIVAAGCISTGRDIAAALVLGADYAYMGTRFITTRESMAPDGYKEMIVESKMGDIVYTSAVSGVPANFLEPSLAAAGIDKSQWNSEVKLDFGGSGGMEAEAKAWKTIWSAGQGVTSIDDIVSVETLTERLRTELREAVTQQAEVVSRYL